MIFASKVIKAAIYGGQSPILRLQLVSKLAACYSVPVPAKGAFIHTSSCRSYPGKDWRKKQGMPANPNSYGPLTDGPDYSFLDGRPTPPGKGKIRRAGEQKEIATKILNLNAEVDFAVANHAERVKKEKQRRANIIERKLKPKGSLPPEVTSR